MWPETTTFSQNGFVVQIYTKQICHKCKCSINTLELQVTQVPYTSNTEVIQYMGKSLSSMQVSTQENMV